MNEALLVAVQLQLGAGVTPNEPAPPARGTEAPVGANVNTHGGVLTTTGASEYVALRLRPSPAGAKM